VSQGPVTGRKARRTLIGAMVVYLVVVGLITLTPASSTGHAPMWYVARWIHHVPGTGWVTVPGLEYTANVVMFVPLGLLGVPLAGRARWWRVVLVGVALTCAIETAQHWIPGRVPDVLDVTTNSLGALLGAWAALLTSRWWEPRLVRVGF